MSDITGKFHDLAERALIERNKARAERDKAVHMLTVIAEACEENRLDLAEAGNTSKEALEAFRFATETGRRARATLAEIEGARPTPPKDGEG